MTELLKFLPFVSADAAGKAFVGNAVSWVGGIAGGIVAIFLIISLVKDIAGTVKGSGDASIWKIIGKAATSIVVIVLIVVVINIGQSMANGEGGGDAVSSLSSIVEEGVSTVSDVVEEIDAGE